MKLNWNYPTNVWVGEGRSLDLIEACNVSKVSKPLFVTDKDLMSLPMTLEIIANLKNSFSKNQFLRLELDESGKCQRERKSGPDFANCKSRSKARPKKQ